MPITRTWTIDSTRHRQLVEAEGNYGPDIEGDIATHEADTTSVHGITDTALLATKVYADAAGYGDAARPQLTSGFGTYDPLMSNALNTMSNQVLRGIIFRAPASMSCGSIRAFTGSVAAGATPTLIRFGLWTIDANGSDLTLAGSTANDTALLSAINTGYAKALSSAVPIVQGTKYAVGLLVVTGAAAPTICGITLSGTAVGTIPRRTFSKAGQADLPNNITSFTDSVSVPYFELIPA